MSDADDETPLDPFEVALIEAKWSFLDHALNQAEDKFRRALVLKPDDPEGTRFLGLTLIKLGRRDEGLTLLRQAATASPDKVLYWYDLAVALRDAGQAEAAQEAYDHALTLQSPLPPLSKAVYGFEQTRHPFQFQDYDYTSRIRFGGGRPPHPQLSALIETGRNRYGAFLGQMQADLEAYYSVPETGDYGSSEPFWLNTWFAPLDGMSLHTMLRVFNPARFIEIGSGVSTKFARRSVQMNGLRTRMTSIDPKPRNVIDTLCDEVRRQPLEECPLSLFDTLEAGDILFLDSSHRAFQGSDVTVFFMEILPRLKPGVVIHIHDILLPDDYLAGHLRRQWNEQYLLATALMFGGDAFEILFPCWYMSSNRQMAAIKDAVLRQGPLSHLSLHGMSFWMRKT